MSGALRGLLIDVDGTLIDSNDAHADAWVAALREAGRAATFEQVRPLIGMGSDKMLPRLTGLAEDDPAAAALVEGKKRHFARMLPSLRPFAGTRPLLERLRDQGLELVVATSAGSEEATALLEQAGVADLMSRQTSSSDADNSKPDPDIVRSALRKGGLSAATALMLGDTPYDVEAATRAGVRAIALRCGGWWDDRSLGGAVAIYDDPADLLARLADSPLGAGG